MTTGPERVREACRSADPNGWTGEEVAAGIARYRDAVRAAAPPDAVVFRPDGSVVGQPEPAERRLPWRIRLAETVMCPGCLRLRCSPVHLLWRAIGVCDGRNCC